MRLRLPRIVRRILGTAALFALVVMAAVVTLGRHYMPQLGRYQQQILAEIRAHVDLDFEVGRLEGEWRGLSPVIRLKNVKLFNPAGEVVVEARHLSVDVDLLGTLFRLTPMARAVSLVNAEVQLARGPDQRIGLAGIKPRSDILWTQFLEQLQLLELADVRIVLRLPDASRQVIHSLDLVMRKGLYLYQIDVAVAEPMTDSALRLRAEFSGHFNDPELLRCHVALDNFNPATLRTLLGPQVEKLPQTVDGEAWLAWEHDQGWSARGRVRAARWALGRLIERGLPEIDALGFTFFFQGDSLQGDSARAWSGRVDDATVSWAGEDYAVAEAQFARVPEGIDLRVSALDLAQLVRAGRTSGLLPERLLEELNVLEPSGELRDVYARLPLDRQQLDAFGVRGRLTGVATKPWRGAPALGSVDGYLEADLRGGFVDLDGSPLQLEFPGLFREPFRFDRLDARVAWEVGEHVVVKTGVISAAGDFGEGRAHLQLDIPLRPTPGEFSTMSLVIGARDTAARYRERFLPTILSKELLDWLDSSVISADVDSLGFIYFGALGGGPLDKTLQLFLDVRNGRLRYQRQWPLLADVDAEVVLSNGDLSARADAARLLNSAVNNLQVELSRDGNADWIGIRGDIAGPGKDLIQLLNETPLQDATGAAFTDWRATGSYNAELDLKVPLVAGMKPELVVKGRLSRVAIANRKLDIAMTDISGDLRFTSWRGLAARRIKGRLCVEPLLPSVRSSRVGSAGGQTTIVEMSAPVAVDRLDRWLDVPASALASGRAQVRGTLTIAPEAGPGASSLVLRTDLEDVALALPAPFGKSADQRRTLELRLALGRRLGYGELNYGSVLRASFVADQQPVRGAVWLGSPRKPALPERGLVVSGQLQQAELSGWLEALRKLLARLPGAAGLPDEWLAVDDLMIRELDVFGQRLQRVGIDAHVVDRRWQVDVDHPRIAGSVRLPVGDGALEFDLARLHLPLGDADGGPPAIAGSALSAVQPASLPRARIAIEKLWWGARDMGRWRLRMVPTERGLQVSGISGLLAGATFGGVDNAEGADLLWTRDARGQHRTELLGMMRARNVDDLFSQLGYDTGIISASGEAIADLHWDGAPDAFSLRTLQGDIYVRLRDGQLMQTSGTAADALKVLGILNVNHLARRLRLDFSDIYQTGFSYDTVQGILLFNRGVMTMQEPLVVDGVSSDLKLTGSFDLLGGDIDAELVVGLPISSNLPWVVALAVPGGVPIAAGVFVAGKVFEKQLLRLTSAVYKVRGSLERPRVEFKQITDAGRGE